MADSNGEQGQGSDHHHCTRHGSLISTRPLPLRRPGGHSWNPFRWIWLVWRYGWTNPDEDLLGVIDAAGDALRTQIASAQAVLTGDARTKADEIDKELEDELCRSVPNLAALLGLEARINALYPPAIQRRRAWMLRERFERVAPARAVAEYWASSPPEPGGPEVLAEELRRCEAVATAATAATAALTAARAGTDQTAVAAAQERYDRATAERDVARAHVEADRARRAMAAAADAARAAATGTQAARDAAQATLDAARGALGAAMAALDAAEEVLVQRGGAIPPTAGTAIDADAQTLLGYIHSSYMMSIGREKAVRDLMRWLIMRFWSANIIMFLAIAVVFIIFKVLPNSNFIRLANLVLGLFFIAAVGRIGATMSVMQRLQAAVSDNILSGDAFLELARLRTGKHSFNLALFSGAVFALLLYAIFATGAPAMLGFENGLFPQVAMRTIATTLDGARDGASTAPARTDDDRTKPAGASDTGDSGNRIETANSLEGGSAAESRPGAGAPGKGATPARAPASAAANTPPKPGEPPARPADVHNGPTDEKPVLGRVGNALLAWLDTAPSVQCKAFEACDPFTQFAEALGFPTRMDFFKLLLWAFLAGFAERLVPDVLNSITNRTRNGLTSAEHAAAARDRPAAGGAAANGAHPAQGGPPDGGGGANGP